MDDIVARIEARRPAPAKPLQEAGLRCVCYLSDMEIAVDIKNLSHDDKVSLCDAAQAAWNKLGPNGRRAPFMWRSKKFVATHSTFALRVETPSGELVTGRYD